MEVDNENTTEINSYLVNNVMMTDMIELSKKRKYPGENFLLPIPKHTCISHIESGEGSNTLADSSSSSISSSSSTNWVTGNYDSADSTMVISPDEEYRNNLELLCSDYGISEIKENFCFDCDEKNPNSYVLSSSRWSVGQDLEEGGRKPTIDQEFESISPCSCFSSVSMTV